jgi:hypothetical protein
MERFGKRLGREAVESASVHAMLTNKLMNLSPWGKSPSMSVIGEDGCSVFTTGASGVANTRVV